MTSPSYVLYLPNELISHRKLAAMFAVKHNLPKNLLFSLQKNISFAAVCNNAAGRRSFAIIKLAAMRILVSCEWDVTLLHNFLQSDPGIVEGLIEIAKAGQGRVPCLLRCHALDTLERFVPSSKLVFQLKHVGVFQNGVLLQMLHSSLGSMLAAGKSRNSLLSSSSMTASSSNQSSEETLLCVEDVQYVDHLMGFLLTLSEHLLQNDGSLLSSDAIMSDMLQLLSDEQCFFLDPILHDIRGKSSSIFRRQWSRYFNAARPAYCRKSKLVHHRVSRSR